MANNTNESITFVYKNESDGGEFTFKKTIKDGDCVETLDVAEAFAEFLTVTGFGEFYARENDYGDIELTDYSADDGEALSDALTDYITNVTPTPTPFLEKAFQYNNAIAKEEANKGSTLSDLGVGDTVKVVSDSHTDAGKYLGFVGSILEINPAQPYDQTVLVTFAGETWWFSPTVLKLLSRASGATSKKA